MKQQNELDDMYLITPSCATILWTESKIVSHLLGVRIWRLFIDTNKAATSKFSHFVINVLITQIFF
jgi:hypothetical protein